MAGWLVSNPVCALLPLFRPPRTSIYSNYVHIWQLIITIVSPPQDGLLDINDISKAFFPHSGLYSVPRSMNLKHDPPPGSEVGAPHCTLALLP